VNSANVYINFILQLILKNLIFFFKRINFMFQLILQKSAFFLIFNDGQERIVSDENRDRSGKRIQAKVVFICITCAANCARSIAFSFFD